MSFPVLVQGGEVKVGQGLQSLKQLYDSLLDIVCSIYHSLQQQISGRREKFMGVKKTKNSPSVRRTAGVDVVDANHAAVAVAGGS